MTTINDYLAEAEPIAKAINAKANTKYSALDAYCALDCQHNLQGMLDRIVARYSTNLRYSAQFKVWYIFYRPSKNDAVNWQALPRGGINHIISDAVDQVRKEIALIQNAKRIGLFPHTTEDDLKNIFRFYYEYATNIEAIEIALRNALPITNRDYDRLGITEVEQAVSKYAFTLAKRGVANVQ